MTESRYIFVSHSHHDNAFTSKLCTDLRAAGIPVWVDLSDTHGGDFVEHINSGLDDAQAALVIVTPDSLHSIAVRTEAHAAIHLLWQRRIQALLPVIASVVEEWMIPPLWSIFHRYDAVDNYGQALAELTAAITSGRLGDYSQMPDIGSLIHAEDSSLTTSRPIRPLQANATGQIVIDAKVVEGDAKVIGYQAPQPPEHQTVSIHIDTLRERATAIGYLHQATTNGMSDILPLLFLFDVDGVLTNPINNQPAIDALGNIAELLHAGHVVALNSGRGLPWIVNTIVAPLSDILWDVRALDHFCIVSEKGAALSTIQPSGDIVTEHDQRIHAIPADLRMAVLRLLSSSYAATMFSGDEKEYVLSPQALIGTDRHTFKMAQNRLNDDLHHLLEQRGLSQTFTVDPTGIATDIQDHRLGKALGTQRILSWLQTRHLSTQRSVVFGDSPSDIQMASELYNRGIPVEFVFVGDPDQLDTATTPFPVIYPSMRYDRGVVAYLRQRERQA